MDEIIQIKCPFDGAVLSVKNQPGIENRNVTCPICQHKYPFTQFKRVTAAGNSVNSSSSAKALNKGGGNENDATELPEMNFTLGRLKLLDSDIAYQLQLGRNVIGRKGTKSQADFQIDTPGARAMSREHIVIEIKKIPAKGFVHYLSLFKEKVNPTFIGKEPLLYGDCIILSHGDVISLPGAELKFELPDDEATEL